ncbi:MAG: branched-chain amino acid aminotransferase [Dehalococcoidia bacterium DG_22]|nr:MAG: branched-chain amino acid aminotransferase [Dehalococcoidia bacterium DG_22]
MATPYAYLHKQFVPLAEAKISVMTHAFNYGTAVFEGIRGNWNEEEKQPYIFRLPDHYQRLSQSCRILKIDLPYTNDELCDITVRLVEMCGYQEDVYVRPIAYKSAEALGVRLHDLEDDFLIFVIPFGPYLDIEKGARCGTSSWRRIYDEAIILNEDGHVSEGTGENIFVVEGGRLITPPAWTNILMGITRDTVITLAREELGIETIERPIDRSELYLADECFMTGTAAHVTPVIEVDHRPVGDGKRGPITAELQRLYLDVERGKNEKYAHWCTACHIAR